MADRHSPHIGTGKNPTGGFAWLPVLLVIALIGSGYGAVKGGWFSGESKRAKTSTQTTQDLVSAEAAPGASAAAYVQEMTTVAATLPESKEKAFLGRAGSIALSYLPAPDPVKLLEAERLKNAFLSGQLELANTLTANALQDAGAMQKKLTQAIAAKRASDMALEEAAAEARGANENKFWLMLVAAAGVALYLYTKLTHVSPGSLARIVADIRGGTVETNPALQSIDALTTPVQQWMTRGNVWFNAKLAKLFS